MTKLFHIAWAEILYHLRQWAFYLTAIGLPLLFAAAGAMPRLQSFSQQTPLASVETVFNQPETLTVPTGYVDYARIIKMVPPEERANFRAFASESEAVKVVQTGQIESYYVIPADFIQSGQLTQYSPAPQLLADADEPVQRLVRENLLRTLPDSHLAAPLKLIRRGPPPAQFSLIPAHVDMRQLTTAGLVVGLFAYLLNISGSLLVRALQRETQARVLEVLIASTRPAQFIGGKIMGLASLSLGQAMLTLLAGALVYGHNPDGSGLAALPLTSLALSLPYLLSGYIAYCGLIMAVAVIWPNLPESLSLLTIIRLLALSPALGIIFIFELASASLMPKIYRRRRADSALHLSDCWAVL